jgi:cell division protein FtsB
MQKIIFLCLIGLLVVLPYQLKYGLGGYLDNQKLKAQIIKQSHINESLVNRNSLELMKIEGLKGSTSSLEARARYELNLVKPGETLVLLPGNYAIKTTKK